MNERFKELAKQAGYLPDNFGVGHWDMPEFKKFSELIVSECVNICEAKRAEYTKLSKDADNFTDKNLWAEGGISAHRIRISIQEHFGVEG